MLFYFSLSLSLSLSLLESTAESLSLERMYGKQARVFAAFPRRSVETLCFACVCVCVRERESPPFLVLRMSEPCLEALGGLVTQNTEYIRSLSGSLLAVEYAAAGFRSRRVGRLLLLPLLP